MPRRCLVLLIALCTTPLPAQKPAAQTSHFSVAEALSAPFMNQLTAAPAKSRVAWFVDQEGSRNVWVASPTEKAHAVTHYTADDGQDIDDITWAPDAEAVAYTHGTGPEGSEHPAAANPAHLQSDVKQRVEVATVSGVVKVIGEGHAPLFSADGRQVYFLRHGQIWFANLTDSKSQASTEAKAEQLVQAHGSASQLRLSPDGTRLAFVSHRGDHSFIGVFDLGKKLLTYVDPGTGLDHDPSWSLDSKRIAFIRESPIVSELDLRWMRSVPVPWSIRIADVSSGAGKQVWQADAGTGSLFHEIVAKNQLLWMNDGRIVFPWEKTGWLHLYSLAPDTKTAQLLTPGDFEIDNVVTDGKLLVYSSNQVLSDLTDADRKHIWSVSDNVHAPVPATQGDGIETDPALLSDGNLVVLAGSSDHWFVPATIGTRNLTQQPFASVNPIDLTCNINGQQSQFELCERESRSKAAFRALMEGHAERTAAPRFVTPKLVTYAAVDNLQIHAQLFLPKDAKPSDKLPTIVFFHGGSRRQMLLGYNPMQYYAQTYEMNQYFANHGYAVLSVNYRSGIGYGMEFRQAQHYGAFGGSEYLDIEGAVKWLKAQPWCDTKRIGAWGGSYGGYLTGLALARDSADFAAGVDLHGVHDWSYELDLWKPTSDPAHDTSAAAKVALEASPMADVGKWKSPVLLMQGDDDRNVLFGQTVRLAAALRAQGVTVEEKIFPDEVHDFLLHKDWITAFELAADFFDRHLKAH
ncbi:MAG: S9 family peptidase [Janthinobacterium lividum]